MKKTINVLAVVLFLVIAGNVSAAGLVPCGGPGETTCDLCFLFAMAKKAVDFILLSIIPPVAALIIILSGINLYANKDNAEAVNKTKKVLFSTLMGLLIIFAGWVVVNTSLSAMKVAAWEGSEGKWWKFTLTCENNSGVKGYLEEDLKVCGDEDSL